MPTPSTLDGTYRARAWESLRNDTFDVLVVGGGVTGAGVALDAATRGLSVALVEQRDFASGTSSRSSKLFHGGLRYLEQLNFTLVREALRERELMLTRIAPHLVKPVSFLYPLKHRFWERPYVTAGLTLYDSMGGARTVPRHRQLSRSKALQMVPALRNDALTGALLYYDAQADDARHTLTVARTAASYGATVLSSAQVEGLLKEGDRVVGATVEDVETGDLLDVRARVVINATGVWTDEVQTMAGGRGRFHVRASKGVHIVVPRDRINSETGLILRTEKSVLFVIPWGTHWVLGTTDTDWDLDKAHPAASRTDIDYILDHVNSVLATPLTHDDIEGVYAGLRPLLSGENDSTSQLSREHAVARPQPGLISIAGGKYTTYRVMAADAVDAARADLGAGVPDSVTAQIPLLGAEGYHALMNQVDKLAAASRPPGLADREAPRPLRVAGRGPARARARGPLAAGAGGRRRGLPARRAGLRRHRRGGAAPRRPARPAYPDLDRDAGPRTGRRGVGGRRGGSAAGLGRRPGLRRARGVPLPGGGRARVPARGRRPGRQRHPARCSRHPGPRRRSGARLRHWRGDRPS